MKTIELTDEQADELRNTIDCEIERLDGYIASYFPGDPDHVRCTHEKSVLSAILHLLEIA
jgi:hypothetical protein